MVKNFTFINLLYSLIKKKQQWAVDNPPILTLSIKTFKNRGRVKSNNNQTETGVGMTPENLGKIFFFSSTFCELFFCS